jgi:hypothetical protein
MAIRIFLCFLLFLTAIAVVYGFRALFWALYRFLGKNRKILPEAKAVFDAFDKAPVAHLAQENTRRALEKAGKEKESA